MASALSPAKVLLLAVHFATHADIDSFAVLCQLNASTLHEELLLRILLTYLPETLKPASYVGFLQQLSNGQFQDTNAHTLDLSPVIKMTEVRALKQARRLHLRSLKCHGLQSDLQGDALDRFLVLRARSLDTETGISSQLLDLLLPFVHRSSYLHMWILTIVLPYVKKEQTTDYQKSPEFSLNQFETLSDRQASNYLLLQSDSSTQRQPNVDYHLRGIIGPWLYNSNRWKEVLAGNEANFPGVVCEGWQEVMNWLILQAASSWSVAVQALEKWGGLDDVDFGYELTMELPKQHQDYSRETYATTTLACVYCVQDTSLECLSRLYDIVAKLRFKLAYDEKYKSLEETLVTLPDLSLDNASTFWEGQTTRFTRNNVVEPNNRLTSPNAESTKLLLALILSAYILTLYGLPSSVRTVRDLTFLRDMRDQKAEFMKILRAVDNQKSTPDDEYMTRTQKYLLWLRGWRDNITRGPQIIENGTFGAIDGDFMDAELLRLLLSKGRYDLARSLYEDADNKRLPVEVMQEAVYKSALAAFDNAKNPNRARGGLKRCDEILNALPSTVGPSLAGTMRIQALLKATHALSNYRLVVRAGEPFNPVVLRVHSDPISIIGNILEQNHGAYTRLQEFLEMGVNISKAGLPCHSSHLTAIDLTTEQLDANIEMAERRITALCVQAALREEDFETAYSYVANRLGSHSGHSLAHPALDEWSWKAALQAGQYIRTERSKKPTHLGTASGNLDIRHLEQRIECLATALRLAPTSELQDILKIFRRCEEQLDSAIKEEVANEAAWDTEADADRLPGAFGYTSVEEQYLPRTVNASAAARQADEAPMSLLDLSRATARIAQRNLSTISGLQSISGESDLDYTEHGEETHHRVRKRDQLREAATGTLVSGVGWLIGANVNQKHTPREGM
ncbi:hypothetical protein EsDP_00004274 [Epichloe bromicola]|uniref:Sec39 domain-containing protein n=1 Tax=Epichloe bromicola TaxID=79588 RepID=A0ABQ0CR78_9HYPO